MLNTTKQKRIKAIIGAVAVLTMAVSIVAIAGTGALASDQNPPSDHPQEMGQPIANNKVGIPDPAFYKMALKYDSNKDGILTTDEAAAVEILAFSGKVGSLNGIGYFTGVKKIVATNIGLKTLPKEIGNLKKLESLNLSSNSLKALPKEIGELKNLTVLFVANNRLTTLPDSINELASLERLNVSYNKLTKFPATMRNMESLIALIANNNQITAMPDQISYLKKLKTVQLANNKIQTIPEGVKYLKECTTLDVSNNNLTALGKEVGSVSALETLRADHNQISTVATELGNLTTIQTINLGNNQIKTLPSSFSKLKTLTDLNLSNNQLKKLPNLTKLSKLAIQQDNLFPLNVAGNLLTRATVQKYAPTALVKNAGWLKMQTAKVFKPVTEITVAKLALQPGETRRITATVTPADASCTEVSYQVYANQCNATLSSNGIFKADQEGTALIGVMARDGSGVTATVTVTVKAN